MYTCVSYKTDVIQRIYLFIQAFVDVHVDKNDARLVREKRYKSVLNQQTRILELLPGYGKLMSYLLLPLRNGHLPIRATARSTLGADSLVRNLLVEVSSVIHR